MQSLGSNVPKSGANGPHLSGYAGRSTWEASTTPTSTAITTTTRTGSAAPGSTAVLDRNWSELLQELRVTQTGTQILTGFLLTLPFNSRFSDLARPEATSTWSSWSGPVVTTGLNLAPVAHHRVLFRRRKRRWLVAAANAAARATLFMLALDSAAVVLFVFDVVLGLAAGVAAAAVVLLFLLGLWGAVPCPSVSVATTTRALTTAQAGAVPPRSRRPTGPRSPPGRRTRRGLGAPAYVHAERTPEQISSTRSSTPGVAGSRNIREDEMPSS